MSEFILYEGAFILLTATAYIVAKKFYTQYKKPYFHTILISVVFIILFLFLSKIDYSTYYNNTRILRFILDVSVVAFGYLLYLNLDFLKKNVCTILIANFLGSLIGILGVLLIAWCIHTDSAITSTLVPKSITTPLAVEISSSLGGIPSLTAVIVVLCGLFGAIIAPSIFKILKIQTPFARGLSLGSSAHGLGTAKALEYGTLEGAVGGLSIGLMGLFTSILAQFI